MKKIKISYLIIFLMLTLAWLMATDLSNFQPTLLAIRGQLVDYSGLLGMGIMSVAMVLAMRPRFLETMLGGLDKGYRLHKWLGVTALVVSMTHWLAAKGPKWLVALDLMERPQRIRGAAEPVDMITAWLRSQRGLAESVGEWAFYIATALIVLALIKRFPYRRFFNTHRLFSLVYLALVFHAVVLTKISYWTQPIGILMALLLVAGTVSALISLTGTIGKRRKVTGHIQQAQHLDNNQVVQVDVQLNGSWPGHQAGQFAFMTFDGSKEAHPFTISSAWQNDNQLSFLIKALGDHTGDLVGNLQPDQAVIVEGPYGQFNFNSRRPTQVWVAGGIGITPFIARMKFLSREKSANQEIHLFYCTRLRDSRFLDYVKRCAAGANVRLHVYIEDKDGLLDASTVREKVPNWQQADFWFCGPSVFGQQLRTALTREGISNDDFHQELFEMR